MTKTSKGSPKIDPNIEPRFLRFWADYPRKVAKGYARQVFYKLKVDDDLLARILSAIEWQKRSKDWTKDGGEFIPHPSTYLNGERWEDEPPKPVRKEIVHTCHTCSKNRYESEMKRCTEPGYSYEWVCKEKC